MATFTMTTFKHPTAPLFILLGSLVGLSAVSFGFPYGRPLIDSPWLLALGLFAIAAIAYLWFCWRIIKRPKLGSSLGAVIVIGVLARAVFLPSLPILEDDFYRYFFDGAVVDAGLNPYTKPPITVYDQAPLKGAAALGLSDTGIPPDPDLAFLQNEPSTARVAYPHIASIYPPVTQAFFWLAHRVKPFDLLAWRCVLLAVDFAALLLLVALLDALVIARRYAGLYWLNPLLISETMNAGHMDVLLVPFLVGSALLAVRGRPAWAGAALAGAVGVKLWPVILAPILFRAYLFQPRQLLVKALPFAAISLLVLTPQILASLAPQSGLVAYADSWQRNSFLFAQIAHALGEADLIWGLPFADLGQAARAISYGIVGLILLGLMRAAPENGEALIRKWLIVTAALFLLAPTGYPWYVIWFLPWLVIWPSMPLLLLTLTLALYDLRFLLFDLGQDVWVHGLVIPLEFLPVLVMLALPHTRRMWARERHTP